MKTNKNGVKLLAAVAVFAMLFAGIAVALNTTDNVDATTSEQISNALDYEYKGDVAYEYAGALSAEENVVSAVYTITSLAKLAEESEDASCVMNDFARFMGALYRANITTTEEPSVSQIAKVTYNGIEYTWDSKEPLKGSNWINTSDKNKTLVSTIFEGKSLKSLPALTMDITLTLADKSTVKMTYLIVVSVTSAEEINTALGAGAENIQIKESFTVKIDKLKNNIAAIQIGKSVYIDGNGCTITATGTPGTYTDEKDVKVKEYQPLVMAIDADSKSERIDVVIKDLTLDAGSSDEKNVAKHSLSIAQTNEKATTVTLINVDAKNYWGNGFSIGGGDITMTDCSATSVVKTNGGGVNIEKKKSVDTTLTADDKTFIAVGVIYSEDVSKGNASINAPKDYRSPILLDATYDTTKKYQAYIRDISVLPGYLGAFTETKISINENASIGESITVPSGSLEVVIAKGKTLTVSIKSDEVMTADKPDLMAISAPTGVKISGGNLVINMENTSTEGHENTYAIKSSEIELENVTVKISASPKNGDAFAISGPSTGNYIKLTNVSGTIEGGNRAIQVGTSTLTISKCSDLTLIGGEKAVQQKNEGGSVKISDNSNVTFKLGETFVNDGTNDRYGLKVNKLSVDSTSTVITDGFRLYDIIKKEGNVTAQLSNAGIIIVKGGYAQNDKVKEDETKTAPVAGMKSDSVVVNAYIGVPLKFENSKIYLDDAKYNANILAIPVTGQTVEGDIVNSADQVKDALKTTDSVVITGNGKVDVENIDVSAVEDKKVVTITITGTATGNLNAPENGASVNYSIANTDDLSIGKLKFDELKEVTITVTKDTVTISGKDIDGKITLDEDGLNIASGTSFKNAIFVGAGEKEYTLSFSTPASSKIMVKQGSIYIGGTVAYSSDIVMLDANIDTDEKVDLKDVTINGTENGKKISVKVMEIAGTVSLGEGVEIVIKEGGSLTLKESAKIIGSGKVIIETGASVVYGTDAQISCKIDVADKTKTVTTQDDFNAANFALYNNFKISGDVEHGILAITENISIPAGKVIDLNGKTLEIGSTGSFKVTDSKIIGAGSVDVIGTFTINNSDVLTDVKVDEDASIVIEKAKSQTITGQSVDSTAVGYGNTLVLDGVTIEYGNTVTAYGNLEIKGTTKIVNGGTLVIGTYGNAKISGTMNVAGSVEAYGAVTIDGTVNVSGSKDKSASFSAQAFGDMDKMVNITKDGVLNIAKPSGNTYTNTLDGYVVVKGTLNMNGTFSGFAIDYGTVKINGTVQKFDIGNEPIPSFVAIMEGVQVDVTALYGEIGITDEMAVMDLIDGMEFGSYEYSAGNIVYLKNVKGVSISTEINTAVEKDGSKKYFYADMYVSGTVAKTDKNIDDLFLIGLSGSTDSNIRNDPMIGPDGKERYGQIYIAETLNIGTGVGLIINDGTVNVDGNLNAVEEDSFISVISNATLTVNGLVTTGGKNNDDVSITNNGTINAATYTVLDPVDFYRTHYYTTADAAIDKIADAEEKTVTVLGKIELSGPKTIASGQTVVINNGSTLTVGSNAVLEAVKGSVIENAGAVNVKGTFVIENYDADFSGTEPKADVLTKDDVKRTYTSLKGAIQSGATKIILNRTATLYSDLTIPEGVLVTTETNGVGITVKKNCTLTVEGGLELPTGIVELKPAEYPSDNAADLIVTGHFLYKNEDVSTLEVIDGAHYNKKINGKYQNIISSVEYASTDVDDSVSEVDIIGEVSASDVTFTKGKNGLLIYVSDNAVLSVKSMKLVGVSLQIVGKMSGSVIASTGLQSDDTGATTNGIIDLDKASGIVIVSKTIEAATGTTDYMIVSGELEGVATVSAGTVTITNNNNANDDLTVSDTLTVDSKLTIAEGATVSVTGADLIVNTSYNSKANLVVEGSIVISGNGTVLDVNGIASVSGTIDIIEKGTIDVDGTIIITGTVNVSADKGKEGSFIATGVVVIGEKPTILGQAGAAAKIDGKIELNDDGYIKTYPGADITTTKINWQDATDESAAFSTSFVINDVVYMTVYTVYNNLYISDIINDEVFELVGLFNGVNFNDAEDAKDTGLYNKGSWYTDAAMSPNKKIVVGSTNVSKDLEAVYAFADAADVYGVISVGTGLNLFIDGVPVNSSSEAKLAVGTHTVRYDVYANYDGSKAVLTFNGQVLSNGSTITIGAGDKTFSLTVSGAVPAESEPIVIPSPTPSEKDDGMGITEYLLIVLVILAAILVVVVAIRMMRS